MKAATRRRRYWQGHLVKRLDALGGLMAKAIDQAGIQFGLLNAGKGRNVRAAGSGGSESYTAEAIAYALENQPNPDDLPASC